MAFLSFDPAFQLCEAVRVLQVSQVMRLFLQLGCQHLVLPEHLAYKVSVYADASVVDVLVNMPVLPFLVGYGTDAVEPFKYEFLCDYVLSVVLYECFPLLGGIRGCVLCSSVVADGWFAWPAEILNQALSCGHLLLVFRQSQCIAKLCQAVRIAQFCGHDHCVLPLLGW